MLGEISKPFRGVKNSGEREHPKIYSLGSQVFGCLTIHGQRQTTGVRSVDLLSMIVDHDVPVHNALNLRHGQPLRPLPYSFSFFSAAKKRFIWVSS